MEVVTSHELLETGVGLIFDDNVEEIVADADVVLNDDKPEPATESSPKAKLDVLSELAVEAETEVVVVVVVVDDEDDETKRDAGVTGSR